DGAEALSQGHHQDRDSPTPKPGSYQTVGAPAPGAKVPWLDSLSHRGRCSYTQTGFAPGAVLLHPNRGSPRIVGAPAPGAKGFGPGLRGSVGERCSALITASIEALAIADQHGAEVVIVAGSALDTAGGIKPEFQPLVMHATEAQGAIRQLLADHRQLTSILGIAAGQQHAAGTYIHPPAIGQTEADPLAVSGTGVHAAAPGGFDPVGPVDHPAAILLGHRQLGEDRHLPLLPHFIKQPFQFGAGFQQAIVLLTTGADGPVRLRPVHQSGDPLRRRFPPALPERPGSTAAED